MTMSLKPADGLAEAGAPEPGVVAIAPTTTRVATRRALGITGRAADERTRLTLLVSDDGGLPLLGWLGTDSPGIVDTDVARTASRFSAARTAWDSWLVGSSPSICPQHAEGHLGQPALRGFRLGADQTGTAWSPLFRESRIDSAADRLSITADDTSAGLRLEYTVEALAGGGLRMRSRVVNIGGTPYALEALEIVVPLPEDAVELLDFTGRWGREKQPQRRQIADGLWAREHRRGMRALDATSMIVAGTQGFGFADGEVIAVHCAWSGNHRYSLERLSSGTALLSAGELLMPGEVVLDAGESYDTPWVHVMASRRGLDGLAAMSHAYLRSHPAHPTSQPVMFNAWEAVYLRHDVETLIELADAAAEVGAERFVLDDGWFRGRDSLTRGLGDWSPDPQAWPTGLAPLIDHVHGLGMEFGLWWEPEAVSPDSDLFRAHPEWVLRQEDRLPPLERDCLLLDLSLPAVRAHLIADFHQIMAESPVDFVKWDHNRDLVDASLRSRPGAAASHAQTLGLYALLDDLAAEFPEIAWESCASGGGRIDIGILERVQSAWTSDNTDPLSRQYTQAWTAQLAPLEYLGSHLTESPSHQTGRMTSLDFRAATAFIGQFGIQWDLRGAALAERERIAEWCALYKQHRELLHSGRLQRVDLGGGLVATGVIAQDKSEAVFSYAQVDEIVPVPPRLRISGLAETGRYEVSSISPAGGTAAWDVDGIVVSGSALAARGLPGPTRLAASAALVHLRRVSDDAGA